MQEEKLQLGKLQKTKSELINIKKEKIEEVLDSNLEEFNEKYEKVELGGSKKRFVMNLIFGGISLIVLIILKKVDLGVIQGTFVDTILVCFISILLTLFVLNVVYYLIGRYLESGNRKRNTLNYLFSNNSSLIKTFIVLVVIGSSFNFFLPEIGNSIFGDNNIEPKIVNWIVKFLSSTIFVVLSCVGLYLIKEIILQSVEYRIHFKFYEKRIEENENIVEFLQSLNELAGGKINPDLEKWGEHIYDCLIEKTNNKSLYQSDFVRYFGNDDGQRIFQLFDISFDGQVTKKEFKTRYASLFEERKNLKRALSRNNGTMGKLEKIITVVFIPLLFFLIYVAVSDRESFSNNFGFIGTSLLSLSFAFANIISELVTCIVFVYFIRPFDVGDMIEIDGMMLRVASLGLFSSNFYNDKVYHSISNVEMKKKDIINYRNLTVKVVDITKKFDYDSCYDKMEILYKKIEEFLAKNRNKFTTEYHVYKYKIEKNIVEMKFEFNVVCRYQEIRVMFKRCDDFALFLYEVTKELGFINRHHF